MRVLATASLILAMQFAASAQFTAAFWGDSRGNLGQAFEEISGYLIAEKGKTVDVHWQNGDFTSGVWSSSWGIKNVRQACVKDYFFMCTSNHDEGSAYLPNTRDILPSNGSNTFYYHKSWDIPGSTRKVHLCVMDLYQGSSWTQQAQYFSQKLADATPEDWICALYHDPTYAYMTYKPANSMATSSFIPFLLGKNADFVLNGHAHQYRRTHILGGNGSVAERTGPPGTSHTTSATDKGIVHIVNGRGGMFSSKNDGASWSGNAFAPKYDNWDGLVTLMEFDGATVNIKTITIGADYKQNGVIDTWSWTRGTATSTAPVAAAASAGSAAGLHVFPNPTRGRLTLETWAPATVSIHTLDGREVAVLQTSSSRTVTWSAVDSDGNRLLPGTYIARARSGKQTYKMEFLLLP